MSRLLSIILLAGLLSPKASFSQLNPSDTRVSTVEANISSAHVVLLGKTKEVREINLETTHRSTKAKFKKDRKRPKNFANRRGESKAVFLDLEHQGPDALRQTSIAGGSMVVEPLLNIDGLTSGSPNDPSGDIGQNYYVQSINATPVRVIDKTTGATVASFSMQSLWSEFGATSAGDPIVLYDETENRWFLTEFTDPANMLIAVSETPDPMGAYFAYNFSTPEFPDYPKFGIWPDALVATTNEGGAGTLHQYFIDKAALINGDATAAMQRIEVNGNTNTEAGFFVSTPVDIDGLASPSDTRPFVLTLDDSSWGSAPEDRINLYRFDVDFNNQANTTVEEINIPVSPYDGYPCSAAGFGFSCIPQLGGNGLDGLPEVIMNVPKFRRFTEHESLVMSFVTDVTDGQNLAGIRWIEMRKPVGSGEWELYQEGTFAPDDGLDRFMSSIAIDANGNIGLAYNVSSPDTYVGIRFTGRLASDPLGEMTVQEFEAVAGMSTIQSGGRFGDYSQMGVDPVDGSTFWYTSEYAGATMSNTRIISFELQPANFDLAATEILNPSTSASLTDSETVSVLVTNVGVNDMTDFTIGYSVNDVFVEEVLVTDTLSSGETYVQEFATPLDFSAVGSYTIDAYISNSADEADFNNEVTKVVQQLLSRDASLSNFQSETSTCSEESMATVTLTNLGFEVITTAQYSLVVNGDSTGLQTWTGALELGQSVDIPVNVALSAGPNDIQVEVVTVNTDTDQNETNNIVTGEVEMIEGEQFIFNLTFDNYPQETSWTITDNSGSQVASGNNFQEANANVSTTLCLNPQGCYTFQIFDSYGDGICCQFGNGSYTMQSDGEELFSGGNFDNEMTHEFCGSGQVSSIEEIALDPSSLTIYPNPNDGYFHLSLIAPEIEEEMIELSVVDVNGKQVQRRPIVRYDQAFVTAVSLVDYPSGAYFVTLGNRKYSVTKQVIKD